MKINKLYSLLEGISARKIEKVKQAKGFWECQNGSGNTILNRLAIADLTEVTFEQRLEGGKGVSCVVM